LINNDVLNHLPTVQYGGLAILGMLTHGLAGTGGAEVGLDAAPVGTLALSGGFFGMAFRLEFRFLLYFGALSMLCSLVLTGVGLLRGLRKVAAF